MQRINQERYERDHEREAKMKRLRFHEAFPEDGQADQRSSRLPVNRARDEIEIDKTRVAALCYFSG